MPQTERIGLSFLGLTLAPKTWPSVAFPVAPALLVATVHIEGDVTSVQGYKISWLKSEYTKIGGIATKGMITV